MKTEPQPGQLSAEFVPPIEYGVPEYQEAMPLTCQPPRICLQGALCESLKNGSS